MFTRDVSYVEKVALKMTKLILVYSRHVSWACLVKTQLQLEAFYSFNERFAKIRSNSIKKAVKGITGKKSLDLMDDSAQDASKSRKKRRVCPSDSREDKLVNSSSGAEDCVTKTESNSAQISTTKRSRTM